MNFDQAIFEMSLTAEEVKKTPANIIISFEVKNAIQTASLIAPKYYKDKDGTLATVKRAWECFCRGDEEKLYSITGIKIHYEGSEYAKEERRITA